MPMHIDARGNIASATETQISGFNVWSEVGGYLYNNPVALDTALQALQAMKNVHTSKRTVMVHTVHHVLGDDAETIRDLVESEDTP